MAEFLRKVGSYAPGAVIFVAIVFFIPALFIVGAAKLGAILFPILELASILAFAFAVLIVVPLSFVQPCRLFAATTLLIASYIFGLTAWVEALLVTKALWGTFAVIFGLFLAGVGIVPVGILATLFHAAWPQFWDLFVLTAIIYGLRFYAFWVAAKADAIADSKRGQATPVATAV